MRPIKVEFQAFGPYVGHEVVDFDAIASKGLFLICGKTGIGKTMILDAMTFALFGKSSGHGRDDFEAMRCTKAGFDVTTFVKFEFENKGEYYLFERRLERKRKNLSASYNLMCKDDAGIWRTMLENAKEKALNDKAVEIIGLEYEQFRQVIVLPQGQFEKLLTSNSDEKEKILTSIFGEEKWAKIAGYFYDEAEARKNRLKGVKDRIQNSLAEEQCENIAALELIVSGKKEEFEKLENEGREAGFDRAIRERQEILATAKRFGDLRKAKAGAEELRKKETERGEWERRLKDAKRADKVRALLEMSREAEKVLSKRQNDENEAARSAETKEKAANEASAELKAHIAGEEENENRKSLKVKFEGKRKDYEGIDNAEAQLKSCKNALKKAAENEKAAKEAYDGYTKLIVKLQGEYATLQAEHEELLSAYLSGITGELAGQLKDGEPCPVCGSTDHPHKAGISENSIGKAAVDAAKKAADSKYKELREGMTGQENAKKELDEKHAAVENANSEAVAAQTALEALRNNLVEGISSLKELDAEIKKIDIAVKAYADMREKLETAEKKAKEASTGAKAKAEAAKKENADAAERLEEAKKNAAGGLKENGFETREEAEKLMLDPHEEEELSTRIANYDAEVVSAQKSIKELEAELEGKNEPDIEECREKLDAAVDAKTEHEKKKAVLTSEISRLEKKAGDLKKEGAGIEEMIREAEEDFAFAKKLRGDSGTGLQRYVLGVMFSSVVAAANKMLEMVHGGRYRLFRSDEKGQGTNKRGLELKVFDKYSEEHDGRFVSTLSGGEKFLASLALSIGMSTVAQKSGIRIEALFIDEGFGSLDDESIEDAMNVLNSIREANGLVGIISHVQILQDRIPSKLKVEEDGRGSHIIQTIG